MPPPIYIYVLFVCVYIYIYIRFTPSIRESYSELHLLRLGRFGKDSYARVLLHCLPNGVETVPAESERKSEVRAWAGLRRRYRCV